MRIGEGKSSKSAWTGVDTSQRPHTHCIPTHRTTEATPTKMCPPTTNTLTLTATHPQHSQHHHEGTPCFYSMKMYAYIKRRLIMSATLSNTREVYADDVFITSDEYSVHDTLVTQTGDLADLATTLATDYYSGSEVDTLLTGYSEIDHLHTGVYSPIGHNHSGIYALITHGHTNLGPNLQLDGTFYAPSTFIDPALMLATHAGTETMQLGVESISGNFYIKNTDDTTLLTLTQAGALTVTSMAGFYTSTQTDTLLDSYYTKTLSDVRYMPYSPATATFTGAVIAYENVSAGYYVSATLGMSCGEYYTVNGSTGAISIGGGNNATIYLDRSSSSYDAQIKLTTNSTAEYEIGLPSGSDDFAISYGDSAKISMTSAGAVTFAGAMTRTAYSSAGGYFGVRNDVQNSVVIGSQARIAHAQSDVDSSGCTDAYTMGTSGTTFYIFFKSATNSTVMTLAIPDSAYTTTSEEYGVSKRHVWAPSGPLGLGAVAVAGGSVTCSVARVSVSAVCG